MRLLKLIAVVSLFLIGFSSQGLALNPNELPFGSCKMSAYDGGAVMDSASKLGFNYFAEQIFFQPGEIDNFSDHGMQVARGGLNYNASDAEAPFKYSFCNYAVIPVRNPYPNPEVRMVAFGGTFDNATDSNWVSPRGSIDTLSGISTYTPEFNDGYINNRVAFDANYYYSFPSPLSGRIIYRPDIYMSIDSIGDPSAVVCTVKVSLGEWTTCNMDFIYTQAITAGQCSTSVKRMIGTNFNIPNSINVREIRNGSCNLDTTYSLASGDRIIPFLNLSIVTTGARQVRVDKILISDQSGRLMMENPPQYDDLIAAKFGQYKNQANKIYGWGVMDEPLYANFLPIKHIKTIMQDTVPSWKIYTYNWQYNPGGNLTRSWLKLADEDYVFPDIYPFFDTGSYSGGCYQDVGCWPEGAMGRWNMYLSWVKEAARDVNKDFWIALQAHKDDHYLRMPTNSELSCETYLAMAWGTRGINYYFYNWPGFSGGDGIMTSSMNPTPTPLYFELRDSISPYIQAVDSNYMSLTWDSCYVFDSSTVSPNRSYVQSITALPDPNNPDAGWFQVGQFIQGSDKYILLVNRACNKDSTHAAPPVSAIVRFSPGNLNLGDYLFITDLADSLYHPCDTCDWVGIPKTTYSAKMADNTIPYTITLKAGEGKLLKIASASEIRLGGMVNTDYIYQGRLKITQDATVDTGKTMLIRGPARFEAYRCDSLQAGHDSQRIELNIKGRINAIGRAGNEVVFFPDTLYSCGGTITRTHPQPHDWYGIRPEQNAACSLSYCTVAYAGTGIYSQSNGNVKIYNSEIVYNTTGISCLNNVHTEVSNSTIAHNVNEGIHNYSGYLTVKGCTVDSNGHYGIYGYWAPNSTISTSTISNDSIAGIYNYGGYFVVDSSYIHDNLIYGIYSYDGDNSIYGCRLHCNIQYGIKVYRSNSGKTLIQYDTLSTCATPSQNGYAISINSNDDVTVYKCKAKGYIQAGLYLNDSNALVKNNDFSGNTNYSIFADNYSFPKIRQCRLDTTKTGVYSNNSKPDIGTAASAADEGLCSFLSCSKYYICHSYNPGTLDSMKALYNYYETNQPPISSKFKWVYANSPIKWNPYLQSPPPAPRLEPETQIPIVFELRQNYPNPFNPTTTISFVLDEPAQTQIMIYNLLGQKVNTLFNEYRQAGEQAIIWNGTDEFGKEVSSGVYFYVIQSGEHFQAKKMTLLR